MQTYLEHEELWECVEGTNTTAKQVAKAKAKIILSIHPINYVHVQNAKTAKEAWENLIKAFDDKGLTRRVGLLRTLITTQLENCDSVEEYVNKIISTGHKLTNIGFVVSDEWLGTLLLAGLPDHYRPMIMGLESSGIAITSDSIKVKLLQEVKVDTSSSNKNGVAFFGNHAEKKNYTKNGPRCFECNKIGHLGKNCFKRKARLQRENGKSSNTKEAKSFLTVLSTGNDHVEKNEWYIDSGASVHLTNDKTWLTSASKPPSSTQEIIVANKNRLNVDAVGEVNLDVCTGGTPDKINVKEVMFVPDLTTNLLSVSKITNKGHKVYFESSKCSIYDKSNALIASATLKNGMYKLDRPKNKVHGANSVSVADNIHLWHSRLGHPSTDSMNRIKNGVVTGTNFKNSLSEPCEVCVQGKQHRLPFKPHVKNSSRPLELIHSDLCGPMEENSLGGSKYFLTFVDDFTHKVFVYFLRNKSEVHDVFQEFKNMVENQTGNRIKTLRTDNGTEYVNNRLLKLLKLSGICHQTTIPHTPEQNGVAERMNRTIIEKTRCLLIGANLKKRFWAEAVNTAVHLINRAPTRTLKDVTPNEAYTGKKPDLSYLKVFGCRAFVHVPKQQRRKLDPKSEECIHVGYANGSKGYRLYHIRKQKIVEARDVVFFEKELPKASQCENNDWLFYPITDETNLHDHTEESEECEIEETQADEIDEQEIEEIQVECNVHEIETNDDVEQVENTEREEPAIRKSSRERKAKEFSEYICYHVQSLTREPKNVEEAVSSPECTRWLEAMQAEYDALIENKTWTLTDLPTNAKVIDSKWVFKTKLDQDGNIDRFKARLVVKGCCQRKGIDYQETYSPVVRYNSIRLILGLAVKYDFDIDHMDAVTAFLQGDLNDDIFIQQPELFEVRGQENKVCKLNKAMYGLKQAGRQWNLKLHQAFIEIGLNQSKRDECIYYLCKDNKIVIVAVYVDDLLILGNDSKMKNELKKELESRFKMKDLGELQYILGIRVTRDRKEGKLWLDQSKYLEEVLSKFNMANCNPTKTPLSPSEKLTKEMCPKSTNEVQNMENVPYQEAVGSLMYACQGTRPDLAYSLALLSRFNNNPGSAHWSAVKRVLRYIQGTKDFRLCFTRTENGKLAGFCDADWAGDEDERRSTTGYVFTFQGAPVSWNSKKQPTIALSTTEAEYMALSAAAQEAIWLQGLLNELMPEVDDEGPILKCDNKSAVDLSRVGGYRARTKHIDVRHHFLREQIQEKAIQVQHIASKEMTADVMTKALPLELHEKHLKEMGLKKR